MEKTNEMNLGRITILGLSLVLAIYVGLGLYWGLPNPITDSVTWGMVIGAVTGLVIFGTGYYLCMLHAKSITFLNEVEGELRKVVWPKASPVSASTELWQYTLAVIGLMLTLVVYISIVDSAISFLLGQFILK